MFSLMIICKRQKTPYSSNKSILWLLSKWEWRWCLLYMYIRSIFVCLWCTPLYIECFRCVIDKCNHYCHIAKIFDMVFAGGGRTIWFHAIEFYATVFIWTYVHMFLCRIYECMFICSYIIYYQNTYMNGYSYERILIFRPMCFTHD